MKLKYLYSIIAALISSVAIFAQMPDVGALETISWSVSQTEVEEGIFELKFTGIIANGYHTYDTKNEFAPTGVEFTKINGLELVGDLYEINKSSDYDGGYKVFFDKVVLGQKIKVNSTDNNIEGSISWLGCTETTCASPEYYDFSLSFKGESSSVGMRNSPKTAGFDWMLILQAIFWGIAMLLTPCVFPMVPMTVSFFMKGSGSPAAGRFKAAMYGFFIVLLYTLPITIIIIVTRILGGDSVTADIFNWMATHWLPNIVFFVIFMIFAASFLGAFEITLPSSLVNKSDKGADKGGILGTFFMALTLVLVSFSCTGPIVGTVILQSTSGEFWTPIVTMLAFSITFALPFTLLALFPSLLKNLPKSGGWLNSVKVVLGFIEIALGFKFLSMADQTYHWGLLDREIYLAIWIVVFTLLGFYLLGKLRFAHDDKVEHISVKRVALAIVSFTFVVYMIPGMFGAPLKGLSGYLPPMGTQDFVLGQGTVMVSSSTSDSKYKTSLPHGLQGYYTIEEAVEAAKEAGKPIFVDITGHGCVNCREMEARVWSDPTALASLRDDYIILALYTDDKMKLDKKDWITTEGGKELKDLGRVNSYIARTKFGVNSQPAYIILNSDGEQVSDVYGYDLNARNFVEFLESGK